MNESLREYTSKSGIVTLNRDPRVLKPPGRATGTEFASQQETTGLV